MPRVDDGVAQAFEAVDVEGYVVVDEKHGAGAVGVGVANIGEHAVEGICVEVAAAHLDDGAEAAIEGAAARGLDHVDRPAQHVIAREDAGAAVRQSDITAFEGMDGAVGIGKPIGCNRVVGKSLSRNLGESGAPGEPRDVPESAVALDGASEFAEGEFAFAANDEIDASHFHVGIGCEAGVIAPYNDADVRLQRANKVDNAGCRAALKGHHR